MQVKQGESVLLFILWCDNSIEEIFTHKVQAEAYMREMKREVKAFHNWRIQERFTVGHDNHC